MASGAQPGAQALPGLEGAAPVQAGKRNGHVQPEMFGVSRVWARRGAGQGSRFPSAAPDAPVAPAAPGSRRERPTYRSWTPWRSA